MEQIGITISDKVKTTGSAPKRSAPMANQPACAPAWQHQPQGFLRLSGTAMPRPQRPVGPRLPLKPPAGERV